jgi:hypothetical protein
VPSHADERALALPDSVPGALRSGTAPVSVTSVEDSALDGSEETRSGVLAACS